MPRTQPDAAAAWTDRQREAFAALRAALPGAGEARIDGLREAAFRQFEEAGLPTASVEEWRSAPLEALARTPFAPAAPAAGPLPEAPALGAPAHRLVFADGRGRPDLSAPGGLPKGARLTTLAALLADDPEAAAGLVGDPAAFAERRLSRRTDRRPQALVALNAALASDGAVLVLEDGVRLERPVEIVHLAGAGGPARAHHLRTLVALGAGAAAEVVETFAGADGAETWTNAVTDISLGAEASLRHLRLDLEGADAVHVDVAHARLGRGASLEAFALAGSAGGCRTETRAALEGADASVRVDGLCLAGGARHVDALTRIDHAAPGGSSAQAWRGIFQDAARGAFQGRIRVEPGASRTGARMDARSLLLGAGARAESKPELEILDDDVACSHASATGELDRDALFYLRSRGLAEPEAKRLLAEAFADAALAALPESPLRALVARAAGPRLRALLEPRP